MDHTLQIADLIEKYPISTDPNFQQKITDKYEMATLASTPDERPPKPPKKYFNHQELTHRLLREVDDLLILSQTGTGKTSEVLGFTEKVRDQVLLAAKSPELADEKLSGFKKVVVLVKGKNQAADIKNQLVCKINPERYMTENVIKAGSERMQKQALTINIKKFYQFTTYQKLANLLENRFNTPELQQNEFADTIFWIDEAHNLIVDRNGDKGEDVRQKEKTTALISMIFHNAPRCKRIISSATPMINDVEDIRTLMNLILPLSMPRYYDYSHLLTDTPAAKWERKAFFPELRKRDLERLSRAEVAKYFRGQIPEGFITECANDPEHGLDRMEPYFRGRVNFVRALDTGAVPFFHGETLDKYNYDGKTIVYGHKMSSFQFAGYSKITKTAFGSAKRQASNFVFPDGSHGNGFSNQAEIREQIRQRRKFFATEKGLLGKKNRAMLDEEAVIIEEEPEEEETIVPTEGYGRYMVDDKNGNFKPTEEFAAYLRNHDNIKKSSTKYHSICELVTKEPGNCFIYGEYVTGSGANVLAVCLDAYGLNRFSETSSIFTTDGKEESHSICGGSQSSYRRLIRPNYRKKVYSKGTNEVYTYAILSKYTTDSQAAAILEAMNSRENKNGKIIKILIGSRVTRDGINLSNIMNIHLIGPEWTPGAMYQAMSRGIRATSHEVLLEDERRRLQEAGQDPGKAKIKINVYYHASYGPDYESSDLFMYQTAEDKNRMISRIMRYCKQLSISCNIHYNRNVRSTDKDYSPECDYQLCSYSCFQSTDGIYDYQTFDIRYADEIIDQINEEIFNLFTMTNAISFENICDYLSQYRPLHIGMALEKIITSRLPLSDRFGFVSYLREDSGGFYLDRSYPSSGKNSYDLSLYTSGIIGVNNVSLKSVILRHEKTVYEDPLVKFEGLSFDEIKARLNKLPFAIQIQTLEEALTKKITGDESPHSEAILEIYRWFIFQFHEPEDFIEFQAQNFNKTGTVGRPKIKGKPRKIKITQSKIENYEKFVVGNEDKELIYVHSLYSAEPGKEKYSEVSRYLTADGTIRIFKPSEQKGWRDTNMYETFPYNFLIQREILSRFEPYDQLDYYGTVINGNFRIVNKAKQRLLEEDKEDIEENAKNHYNGKECGSWDPDTLFECAYAIQVPPPVNMKEYNKRSKISTKIKISEIKSKFPSLKKHIDFYDSAKIDYIHLWLSARSIRGPDKAVNKNDLCPHIENRLREMGRLIEIS